MAKGKLSRTSRSESSAPRSSAHAAKEAAIVRRAVVPEKLKSVVKADNTSLQGSNVLRSPVAPCLLEFFRRRKKALGQGAGPSCELQCTNLPER